MTLAEILSLVRDPKPDGKGGWWGFCPCHPDGTKTGPGHPRRSLHITEKDGRVLIHCFAGCSCKDILTALGLWRDKPSQAQAPEAVYRYTDENGNLLFEVCRFPRKNFRQRRPDGAGGWIWNLKDTRRVLYRLPEILAAVREGRTVFLVEGEKDADNLTALGLAATTCPGGAGKWRTEYSEVLRSANVVILPDNDEPGRRHAEQVAQALCGIAAKVRMVELPGLAEKGDVSDWLAAGGTKGKLLELAEAAAEWEPRRPKPEGPQEDETDPLYGTPYLVHHGCLAWRKPTRDGEVTVPLCNFAARVVRDVARDDGAEESRYFEIEGRLMDGRLLPRMRVPAEKFFAMSWVAQWGVDAVISAGMGAKDRLREAIQLASRGAPQERVYTHLGWRKIDGRWVYLHAGGAVGAEGVLVDPELEGLRRYVLPADGSPEEGMAASLRLLEIGPPEVTHSLWACVWRAPLACLLYPTVVPFLYGQTGTRKSSTVAVFLSHFGGPFSKDTLPVSFLATENALERAAFLCRDAVLVVDDYAPEKHPREAAVIDRKANRLIRQVGNRAARTRCDATARLRPENLPNALVIATGEQLPLEVQSVGARILPVLFEADAVNLDRLTQAQAEAHLLPQAMRGYLEWLAPQMDGMAPRLMNRFEELRRRAAIEGHPRLPEAVAHLYLGSESGVAYALHLGVLDRKRADGILRDTWEALLRLAREHARNLEEERPTLKFLQTLDAIFAQGKGHLLDRTTGDKPPLAHRFGWTIGDGEEIVRRNGDLLGWADHEGIYLIPEAAWRAVNEYLKAAGGFPVRERTLRDMLVREGMLEAGEDGRTVRKVRVEGIPRRVMHLKLSQYLIHLERAGTTGT
ncbi:MAG: hypothetical protein ACUVRC_10520 [Desulfotomaculales bacterium]